MLDDTPLVKRAYNLGLKIVPNMLGLTAEQIEYYEQHLSEIPDALARGFVVPPKFALLCDLGVIKVTDDYDHATALKTFGEKNRKKFYYYNEALTDVNFANPTRVLKPGDKLWARAFAQVVGGTTTSIERMDFLRSQNAVFVGAQGASLVFEQKHDQLPKGKWYASFDEKERLWVDAGGDHGVPAVGAHSVGDFDFSLGRFERDWLRGRAFFCFSDEKPLED
jgi:hypothetical protein